FHGPFSTAPIRVGGVAFSKQDLGVIAVAFVAVALIGALFTRTRLGLGLRAAAVNPVESRLVGIRVAAMLALGWGLAALLGAVAGVMAAPSLFLEPNMMQTVLPGHSGQISLGHGAFMAVGAYTTAILMANHGVRDLWTIPIAAGVAGAIGLLAGVPALRLSGLYLALATFGIAVVLPTILKKF